MAKGPFFLGLITALLALLPCTIAEGIDITDIFTVQRGSSNGGCDNRLVILDQWLSETINSIFTALAAIDEYNEEEEVRQSMSIIFGIPDGGPGEPEPMTADKIAYVKGKFLLPRNFFSLLPNVAYEKSSFRHCSRKRRPD
jgi:hypothetical protein